MSNLNRLRRRARKNLVRDEDCRFWTDEHGQAVPPPMPHDAHCLFVGGNDSSNCLVCHIANDAADHVWKTGRSLTLHTADTDFVLWPESDIQTGLDTFGSASILGRIDRHASAPITVFGPVLDTGCTCEGGPDRSPALPSPFHKTSG
jgi:hypothetical protein